MSGKMKEKVTVGDGLVAELADLGVDTIFGIISIHNIPIYDALARNPAFRVVKPRGESGAVNMADAYARISGRLGVAVTSTGTGAGNAAGALIEADAAGTPLLHITGQVASEFLDGGRGYIHECRDQLSMLRSISKNAYRVRRPEQAVAVLRKAALEALESPTGPVSVEIPIDFQSRLVDVPSIVTSRPVPQPPTSADLADIVSAISESRRPVMWAGTGVVHADASAEFLQLAEQIDAAVLTSHGARGVVSEHDPRCIGYFATNPDVRALLGTSDLLLSVGVRFRGNETGYGDLEVPANHIGIDIDLAAVNRNYPHTGVVNGDAKHVLGALAALIGERRLSPKPDYRQEVHHVRDAARTSLRKTLGPYEGILDAIRETLPSDGIVVRDVTIPTTTWASRMIEVTAPRQTVHPATIGIGQALPMAIGAEIGRPGVPILMMCGDGGFLVNVGELAVAREEGLSFTTILFDDGGYGVLRNLQNAVFDGRRVGVDLGSPDFGQLARSFGFQSVRVGDVASFRSALSEAFASDGQWIIVVDVVELGPTPRPFSGTPSLDLYRPK